MKTTKSLTIAAILIGLGITIPMFMPKIIIPPASYTLASHVPVFIAMFLSPAIAVAVALGTAFGFLMTTTPEIALRALSHVIFALIGAYYLRKRNKSLSIKEAVLFNIIIGVIHATCEVLVILPLYTNGSGSMSVQTLFLMVGLGGFVHSLVDFTISYMIVQRLPNNMLK